MRIFDQSPACDDDATPKANRTASPSPSNRLIDIKAPPVSTARPAVIRHHAGGRFDPLDTADESVEAMTLAESESNRRLSVAQAGRQPGGASSKPANSKAGETVQPTRV